MPPPASPAVPRRDAPSYLHVVPVLEDAGSGEALDPVRRVEPEVSEPEASSGHDRRRSRGTPCGDPFLGDAGMGAVEPPQQRGPFELPPLEPRDCLGEDLLRHGKLVGERLQRAGPAVVKHLCARRARMARSVSWASTPEPREKSHTVSMTRTRGSPSPATRSRVPSGDRPTFTTTSSQIARIERRAGTMG